MIVNKIFLYLIAVCFFISCTSAKKNTKTNWANYIANDSALLSTNIGIAVYDVAQKKYIAQHNSNKYFIPASNTKLLTCYTALKYLPQTLTGLRYVQIKDTLHIQPNADPSFLNDEFTNKSLEHFFETNKSNPVVLHTNNWQEDKWGFGWSWTDFGENYCQERSVMPMYYNTVTWAMNRNGNVSATPPYFENLLRGGTVLPIYSTITKKIDENVFEAKESLKPFAKTAHSFTTDNTTTIALLQRKFYGNYILDNNTRKIDFNKEVKTIPRDSILKIMMHRSDNFYAEQLLLMCSQEKFGLMNNDSIINYLKKNDFLGMPQLPRWVDGSGLSRYNMFTPESLVWLLQQLKDNNSMDLLKEILPTGGEGTLSSLYKNISGNIFAKTGTLSNHAALSGYLTTKSGKQLIFSTLTSGYQGSANPTRRAVEKFILNLYENY